MRASLLALVATMALVGNTTLAVAETAPPQTAPAKPDTRDDALSLSTLPKARQNVKEEGSGHVDALSRDEQRRLERLRAKAAASKPPPAEPKKAEPRPAESAAAPAKAEEKAVSKAPAKAAAREPVPATDKASSSATVSPRAIPQAKRRAARPSREATNTRRSGRRSARAPRRDTGRGMREYAERAPRVGDVVPQDVPLYPAPGYGGRAYPPFPRGDGFGYPPRRAYMEPW